MLARTISALVPDHNQHHQHGCQDRVVGHQQAEHQDRNLHDFLGGGSQRATINARETYPRPRLIPALTGSIYMKIVTDPFMPDNLPPERWQPNRTVSAPVWSVPSVSIGMWRGARGLCPACGIGHVFNGYLTVVPECAHCHAPLGDIRADDAPPYFTIFIVGHVMFPMIFALETLVHPELWVHAAIWLPMCVVLSMGLLRPVKGATLGLMLRLGLIKDHGG